jgi:phosphatidylglycerol:prolipoprotein diacylglycerol transferase
LASAAALGAVGRGFKSLCSDIWESGGKDERKTCRHSFLTGVSHLPHPFFFWDPSPVAFTIPFIDHPVRWYSIFFAVGFLGAYFIVSKFLFLSLKDSKKSEVRHFLDKLSWYLFVGMILGARLGHAFFYEWAYYKAYPAKILAIWEGGLASHGGAIGVLLSLLLFWHNYRAFFPTLSLKKILDFLCVGASFAAGCIRIGNFFNQEILGTHTTAWTAVWFGHPAEASAKMPCHPVQLYESLFYFSLCAVLYFLGRRSHVPLRGGVLSGLFFLILFSFRFFIEYIKLPQTASDASGLYMSQLLSIPFILLGVYLLLSKKNS